MKTHRLHPLLILLYMTLASTDVLHADEFAHVQWIPGVLYLEGIGPIYAVGVAGRALGTSDIDVFAGISGGNVQAQGTAISLIPIGIGQLSAFYIRVVTARLNTQYGRGMEERTIFQQQLSGEGQGLFYDITPWSPQWKFQLAMAYSRVALDGYRNEQGERILINQESLHDITSTVLSTNLKWDSRTGATGLKEGLKVSTDVAITTGRIGQSDQGQWGYGFSYHVQPFTKTLLSVYLKGNHAFVLNRITNYDSSEEVEMALNPQCERVSNPVQRQECDLLANELIDYIAASNTHGTATPLGGSTGLRSYREFYFRGAHTFLEGIEIQWELPDQLQPSDSLIIQWVFFAEQGHVSDDPESLFEDQAYAIGTGLRIYRGELPIRLEIAQGRQTQAGFLSVGLVW